MKKYFGLLFSLCLFAPEALWAQTFFSFADIVEKLQPTVVNISTLQAIENEETGETSFPVLDAEINDEPHQTSLGSGFILDGEGYILTNLHVINAASEVNVTLHNNHQYKAEIVGKDPKTDIALIKITPNETLVPAKLGNSDNIRVGDWVLAIGNPFGLGGSVSAGIISAKSRDIESGPYDNFIQTDASINQGSSGGPMFDLNGEVIGINTAIFSTNGANMGIGFAMPTNTIRFVIDELKTKGTVERGWIGLKIQPNSSDIADSLALTGQAGIVVSSVTVDSPAAKAGIKAGDIILKLNGKAVEDVRFFSRAVAETAPSTEIALTIWRDKSPLEQKILVEKMPEETNNTSGKQKKILPPQETVYDALGLNLADLTPDILDQYHLSNQVRGVVIEDIKIGSDAESKGLRKGNLITQIDKKDIFDMNDVRTYVEEAKQENNRPVLLLIEENGVPHYVAVKLGKQNL